jgi:DNA-binding MarR family transcriptional regulator/GNAT superfamily N-acetyltransferase
MANDVGDRVRRFNRFYTEQIGLLTDRLLKSEYSLIQLRILYEIGYRDSPTAARIAHDLRLDRGYMSRILQRFQRQKLIKRTTSPDDARASLLALTTKGRLVFRTLDRRSSEQVAELLRQVSAKNQQRLLGAMQTIQEVLGPREEKEVVIVLRDPHPGDLGWIVYRHGALYSQEYRYGATFEALVAKIVGEFVEHFDPLRERCWIAERDGEVAGSIFLVRSTESIGKLRLLYVEPFARGQGIGKRLIDECVRFARQAGYQKVTLWTQSELLAARHLYGKAGFVRVKEEPNNSFGRDDLISETWELTL